MDERAGLISHLEEMRKRIIVCLAAVVLASVVSYSFAGSVLQLLSAHTGRLVFTAPYDMFTVYIKISLLMGALLSSPVIFYNLWKFISLALTEREKKYLFLFWIFSLASFIAGVCFAFFIAIPSALKFFMSFEADYAAPMITVNSITSFYAVMLLLFGFAFELPLAIVILAKMGIVSPSMLSAKRKYAIVGIAIIAAILTPPDIASQIMLGVPLFVLYEIGILAARLFYKRGRGNYL